jgi:hypothetical protein
MPADGLFSYATLFGFLFTLHFLSAASLPMPWMVHRSMAYTIDIFGDLSRYAR